MSATELQPAPPADIDHPSDSDAKRESRQWARGKVSGTASALCRQMEDRYSIRAEMRSRGIL